MPTISVIVPVYNVEKYIHRCVDSILNQTFTDFELILVDDGSPDNCGAICDEYAARDYRIRVIHQTNHGLAAARNAGLDIAQGEWILFCDSDDCYNADVLSRYLQSADFMCHRTLYCFNFYNVWSDTIEEKNQYPQANLQVSDISERFFCLSSRLSHETMGYAVWNKLYAKKIIDHFHIRVLERDVMGNRDDWAEDLTFNLQYCMCIDRICVSEAPIYLLSKHGTPAEQNENGLVGRVNHMLRIFLELKDTVAYRQHMEIEAKFWIVVIWHMRRYLYLDAGAKGIKALRQECMGSPYWERFLMWICLALGHWNEIQDRWDVIKGADYKYLLEYLRDGNILSYKMKNYWLWKMRPFCHRIIRRKP